MPAADVAEIDALTANAWLSEAKAVFVDVREPNEHRHERNLPADELHHFNLDLIGGWTVWR